MAESKIASKSEIAPEHIEEGYVCGILSYLFIGILWFFVDAKLRRNSYAKFHVKQALIFIAVLAILNAVCVLVFVAWLVWSSGSFESAVSLSMLIAVIGLFAVIPGVVGFTNALRGKHKEMPLFGHLAGRWFRF